MVIDLWKCPGCKAGLTMKKAGVVAMSVLFCMTAGAGAPVSGAPLMRATNAFRDSLDAPLRAKASLPFNGEERLNWHYFPKERRGVALKELNPAQRQSALDLLKAALSEKGYAKAETVRGLEAVLRDLENGNPTRDPELYYVTVFGEPKETGIWGLRYEGHHLSFNWTVIEGKVIASTPQFLGSNPADVKEGPMRGTRALGAEEDLGRGLVKSLNADQRRKAILSATAPPDILTGHDREAAIQEDLGIAYGELTPEQQGLLLTLIQEVVGAQADEIARERLDKIRADGIGSVKFAWMGGLEKGEGHYYRVQGPTFLIEYDNTQNQANHIHTVWRDFKGDFGLDLLKEHYQRHADPKHPHTHEH